MKKLILAVLAVGVAATLVLTWRSSAPTPASDRVLGTDGADQGAPMVTVQLPERLSENGRIGERIFQGKCMVCHGQNAAGQNGVAPPLVHSIYRPGHHADAAFLIAARNGVRAHHWKFGNMPPVEGITDGEVQMIAGYIRELQQANGIK